MSLIQQHIAARDEQYRLADAAAQAGNGLASAEHIRTGRMEDEAAQELLNQH